ncbi:hypothetical protein [Lentilitoribacter sp. EG35]|uniref:hypothetical protein n=1 Tax=Lentilitoribacter sp. EG35 TaxID=3234192 RepID=UPI0034615314
MSVEVHKFTWHDGIADIQIEATYSPQKFGVMSHLEIRSIHPENAALPITETGYRSHFFHQDSMDFTKNDIVTFIRDWLKIEAQSRHWKKRVIAGGQGELF